MAKSASDARLHADRAAEELAGEGNPVTNRAVRERAGLALTTAAEAARAWNERAAEQQSVPDLPDDVRARLDGIWRTAYVTARQEFDEAGAGWVRKVEAAEKGVAELTRAVAEIEQQLDKERDDEQEAQAIAAHELTGARAAAADAQTRAAKLEGALEAVIAERDRLLAELESARQPISR